VKKLNKEQKKRAKMIAKLKKLLGIDFCACGTQYVAKCDGICRESHTNSSGKVECGELYQVEISQTKPRRKEKKRIPDNNTDDRKKRKHKNSHRKQED